MKNFISNLDESHDKVPRGQQAGSVDPSLFSDAALHFTQQLADDAHISPVTRRTNGVARILWHPSHVTAGGRRNGRAA